MQIFVGNTINTFLLKNKKIFFSEYTKKFYIYKANNFLKLNFQQIFFSDSVILYIFSYFKNI